MMVRVFTVLLSLWLAFAPAMAFDSISLMGAGGKRPAASAPPGGPTVATAFSFSDTGTSSLTYTNSTAFNFGTASADRLVVIAVENAPGTGANVTAVTVNGVSLTPSGTVGGATSGAAWFTDLYYGLVTSGSGVLTLAITVNANINFQTIGIQAWTLKGLATNSPQASATNTVGNAASIAVVSGQILLAGSLQNGGGATYTFSPQFPTAFSLDAAANNLYQAYWASITTTNASFGIWPNSTNSANTIAATFQ